MTPVEWNDVSRHYDGPTLGHAPWKCPACGAENSGDVAAGCVSCGSGSQRAYKAQPSAVADDLHLAPPPSPALAAVQHEAADLYRAADAWAAAHPDATLAEAFVAGHALAVARTVTAPPVTADVAALAPEGKARRTIVAALELFRDQVLPSATEEIASGEWCSREEVDQLLEQLREGADDARV